MRCKSKRIISNHQILRPFSFEKYFLEGFSQKKSPGNAVLFDAKKHAEKHTWLVVKNTRHIF